MKINMKVIIQLVALLNMHNQTLATQADQALASNSKSVVSSRERRNLAEKIQVLADTALTSSDTARHLAAQIWAAEDETGKALSLLESMDDKHTCSFAMWTMLQLKMKKTGGSRIPVSREFETRKPVVSFPYVFSVEPIAMRRRNIANIYFQKAIDINPEASTAYLWTLRIDRSFNRKYASKKQLNYCARIMILEEPGSPLYRDALDHLHWLTHADAPNRPSPNDIETRFNPLDMSQTLDALASDKPELAGTARLLQAVIWGAENESERAREMLGAIEDDQLDAFAMGLMLRMNVKKTRGGKTVGLREIANLEPKLAFPYVLTANRPEREMFGGERLLLVRAIKINPEFSQAYMELLRRDRSLKRKNNMMQQFEYCSRLLVLEKDDSPLYRETWEHLEWLMAVDVQE